MRALCTTDDPIDDLQWHKKLAADAGFTVQVPADLPPEKALNIVDPGYPVYLQKLGAVTNILIRTIDDLKQALAQRVEYFAEAGCRLSDHSFGSRTSRFGTKAQRKRPCARPLAGETLLDYEVAAYQSLMMDFSANSTRTTAWAMQLHIGRDSQPEHQAVPCARRGRGRRLDRRQP